MERNYYYSIILCFFFILTKANSQDFINADYSFGIKPTNIGANDMADVYNSWKTKFLTSCSNGRFRVKFDDPSFTVSEGIAYGMLLSVYANDQETFDGLWLYYKDFRNSNGVMNWKIRECTVVDGQNGATDAELDAAYALIVADKRWNNSGIVDYETDAKDLIKIIKDHEVEANTSVLKPGDAWGGSNTTNPSYFTTSYFRAYGTYTNDSAYWNAVADKCYEIIDNNLSKNNAVFNLVSDWTKADGNYSSEVSWANQQGRTYNYDAARTPWRAAIDYVWYGNNKALKYVDLCNDFVNHVGGFDKIYPGYKQDGTPLNSSYKDPTFTGAYALAALGSNNQSFVNAAYTELKKQVTDAYFGATLRAIYMFGMSGNLFNALDSSVLSNDKFKINTLVNLFPNPVLDRLHLNFNTNSKHKISIYDVKGSKLYDSTVNNTSVQIDVSNYLSGIYFVMVNNTAYKLIKK